MCRGELIYSRAFGSANPDYQVANPLQTIVEIGSFAKPFTCACIVILLDQESISPDDDVRRYVPELYNFDPPVRIRHLLRCRSGIWLSGILPGWHDGASNSPKCRARRTT